jgi:hypothetical protein
VSIVVRLGQRTVTLKAGRWSCADDPGLAVACAVLARGRPHMGYEPWPDLAAARYVAGLLEGELVSAGQPPEYIEERIYSPPLP